MVDRLLSIHLPYTLASTFLKRFWKDCLCMNSLICLTQTEKFAPCFFSNKYQHKRMFEELGILLFIHLLYLPLKPCLEKETSSDPAFIFSLSNCFSSDWDLRAFSELKVVLFVIHTFVIKKKDISLAETLQCDCCVCENLIVSLNRVFR